MASRERYRTPPDAPGFPGHRVSTELDALRRRVAELEANQGGNGGGGNGGGGNGGGGSGGISTVSDAEMLAMSAAAGDIVYNTTYGGLWAYNGYVWLPAGPSTLNRVFDVKDDFVGNGGELDWPGSGTGSVAFLQIPEAGAPGVMRVTASSTSYYRITHTNAVNGGMLLFDDFRYFCWVARLGSNQDTSVVRLGLADSTANDSFVRGVFFQFYPDVDPDNWCAVCVSEGTATTVDTGVGVANTDWHRFEAFYDGDEATFYIDGNRVATIDSNLPTTSAGGGQLHWFCHVRRRSSPNEPRTVDLDFARLIAVSGR